jgi:hypothetical protein
MFFHARLPGCEYSHMFIPQKIINQKLLFNLVKFILLSYMNKLILNMTIEL